MFLNLKRATLMSCVCTAGLLAANVAPAASPGEEALKNRSIAYVMTDNQWAVFQTPEAKEECPQGLSKWGPRERFKAMFPDDGKKRTFHDTTVTNAVELCELLHVMNITNDSALTKAARKLEEVLSYHVRPKGFHRFLYLLGEL